MDNSVIKQIIEDATKLAEQSIAAFEDQAKLKNVEPLLEEANKKASELEQAETKRKTEFRSRLDKVASDLVTRGLLEETNKVAFVNRLAENPVEALDVVEKLSREVKAESLGAPDQASKVAADRELDPFEKMALEEE